MPLPPGRGLNCCRGPGPPGPIGPRLIGWPPLPLGPPIGGPRRGGGPLFIMGPRWGGPPIIPGGRGPPGLNIAEAGEAEHKSTRIVGKRASLLSHILYCTLG